MGTQIKLTGWKAIAVVAVVVAIVTFRLVSQNRTLQTDAVDQIKTELAAEYARQLLPQLQRAAQNPQSPTDESETEQLVRKLSRDNIEIASIAARGRGDDIVVQVEIEVDGGPPPDGESTRYYKMEYSTVTGWRLRYEVGKWSYVLTL
jgi:ABC-type uncharacterized transport system substrate-binding protein